MPTNLISLRSMEMMPQQNSMPLVRLFFGKMAEYNMNAQTIARWDIGTDRNEREYRPLRYPLDAIAELKMMNSSMRELP